MNQDEALQWSSHNPALLACLAVTNGAVLEIGCGFYSTPILHAYCGASDRSLDTVEKDIGWMIKFKDRYSTGIHRFFSEPPNDVYSIVFIDDSPGGENRANHFRKYIDSSDYVIVHDAWRENEDAIRPHLYGCNYHFCKIQSPPTLIASKTLSIPSVLKDF